MLDETRFEFGENWKSYAQSISDASINNAVDHLYKLTGSLNNLSFLDIGSGSGLHSLAALRLGARKVVAIDRDNVCVDTTLNTLHNYAKGANYHVFQADILESINKIKGLFDVVYSWGVLHHTGSIHAAINNSISLVKPGGTLILALYLKTPCCKFWKIEKYIYSRYVMIRPLIKYIYINLLIARHILKEKKTREEILSSYKQHRGMSFKHDVEDWLGGYPYESIGSNELKKVLASKGFKLVNEFNTVSGFGVFGTGCGEWVFTREKQ